MLLLVCLCCFVQINAQTWHQFGGEEYYVEYSEARSYAEAESGCAARNANVANVKTTQVYNFIVGKINATDFPFSFYIGATRVTGTNKFKWTDGTSVDVAQWSAGEPGNHGGNENCVIMGWIYELDSTFRWRDISCSYTSRYICQKLISVSSESVGFATHPTTGATTVDSLPTTKTIVGTTISDTPSLSRKTQTPKTDKATILTSSSSPSSSSQTDESTSFYSTTPNERHNSTKCQGYTGERAALITVFVISLLANVALIWKLFNDKRLKPEQGTRGEAKSQLSSAANYVNVDSVQLPQKRQQQQQQHAYEEIKTGNAASTTGNNPMYVNADASVSATNEASYIEFNA